MTTELLCNYQIDYSKVLGDRILPFVFTLNTEESVLEPEEGEYQKFCYDITAVGEDLPKYADLSHFLFGICRAVTQSDIAEITVSINGDPQNVIWGENVEIKTAEHPDPPTGCTGLKFDFPLDKEIGIMRVCISLRTVYNIGPMNVCLYGGGTTATGLQICGPMCAHSGCDATFYQKETVCVPVKVTPYARPGMAKVTCCGEPDVHPGGKCSGSQMYCAFTVTQSLCVEIPISFGAVVETGAATVQCGDVSGNGCDCSKPEEPEEASLQRNEDIRERRFFNR